MKIWICASSKEEVNKEFFYLAESVAKEISALGYNLIFGASSTGMMARCRDNFPIVYSYTVDKYKEDLENIKSTEAFILDTTFDRSKKMFLDADIILALPGGTGTFAEIFSILEENRSISNPKPFIIYNFNGYYDELLKLIDTSIDNHFNEESIKKYYSVCDSLDSILEKIKSTRKD